MIHGHEGRPRLEIVRDPEDLPQDVKVIEAYCDELLWDAGGKARQAANYHRTPFRHEKYEWSQATFYRTVRGYAITFYAETQHYDLETGEPIDPAVMRVSMEPFDHVFPGRKAPHGVEWFIEAGKTHANAPQDQTYEPAYFRTWLESIWGPLPAEVQERLGIIQIPLGEIPPTPEGA